MHVGRFQSASFMRSIVLTIAIYIGTSLVLSFMCQEKKVTLNKQKMNPSKTATSDPPEYTHHTQYLTIHKAHLIVYVECCFYFHYHLYKIQIKYRNSSVLIILLINNRRYFYDLVNHSNNYYVPIYNIFLNTNLFCYF